MCGIGGILRVHPPGTPVPPPELAIPESWLDIIDNSIKHRGPDGQGRFRDRTTRPDGTTVDVALVHRRMSIIDLDGGAQPMVSERGRTEAEGRVAVVFNGCIYNHRELRKELIGAGHRFVTDHSDTEVLLHGWREWGHRVLTNIDGMFAASIWDAKLGVLELGRDLSGEKPLYVHVPRVTDGHWVVFSSSSMGVLRVTERICPDPWPVLKASFEARIAVLKAEGVRREDEIRIVESNELKLGMRGKTLLIGGAELRHWEHMLANPIKSPRHVYIKEWLANGWADNPPVAGVRELRPGYCAASSPEEEGAAWSGEFKGPRSASFRFPSPKPFTLEGTDEKLTASVRARLEADVPLGCFLSGGIDSGLIAAMAQRALREHGGTLRTFTMRMPSPDFDESAAAATTAQHLGTAHTSLDCSPRPAEDLVFLINQLGLPFGDSSLLPTYWLCRAAREHVKVALSGDGGDELFGGYERHRAVPLIAKYGRWIRLIPEWVATHLPSNGRREAARRLVLACRNGGYEDLWRVFDAADWRRLTGERPRRLPTSLLEDYNCYRSDFSSYLPFDLLRKTDTASMAVPIEVRAPFLNFEIIRSAFITPAETLMPSGQRKGLLRQVARKYLPSSIVDRPKMGFAIPIGDWFRTDYGQMKTLLLDKLNSTDPFPANLLGLELNRRYIQQLIDEHMASKRDHSQRLYMLLVLAIWVDTLR